MSHRRNMSSIYKHYIQHTMLGPIVYTLLKWTSLTLKERKKERERKKKQSQSWPESPDRPAMWTESQTWHFQRQKDTWAYIELYCKCFKTFFCDWFPPPLLNSTLRLLKAGMPHWRKKEEKRSASLQKCTRLWKRTPLPIFSTHYK